MKNSSIIHSFTKTQTEFIPVEIETSLLPGIPQLHIVGLPDRNQKESILRIKSAIKSQGFTLPRAKQIVVNLYPSDVPKNSTGLELAIAVSILVKTDQLPLPFSLQDSGFFGELSLDGNILPPPELPSTPLNLVCGLKTLPHPGVKTLYTFDSLKKLCEPPIIEKYHPRTEASKVPIPNLSFAPEQAEVMCLSALGWHPTILAGPAGSGKSTMASNIEYLMPPPTDDELHEINKIHPGAIGRPKIKPHHTTPTQSLIGGGSSPSFGEIGRAHLGLMILDELLEFSPTVINALRGPLEEGMVRLARGRQVLTSKCQSLVVATTNLCPCGIWTPGHVGRCRYSLRKCRSYSEKLAGPVLDRFAILAFVKASNKGPAVSLSGIHEKLKTVRQWQKQHHQNCSKLRQTPNQFLTEGEINQGMDRLAKTFLIPSTGSSHRRRLALLRVARSIADLEMSELIYGPHIEKACTFTVTNFAELERWE